MFDLKHFIRPLVISPLLLLLCACGGGGDDDDEDFIGAALVTLSASPRNFDTGDRTQVQVEVREVHENGIILKFRFPQALTYVLNSSFLSIDGREQDISPMVNSSNGSNTYLVYYLTRGDFGKDNSGEVLFQLEANAEVVQGSVEVDADVDDPLIDNSSEFNIDDPQFAAEDSVDIEVTE